MPTQARSLLSLALGTVALVLIVTLSQIPRFAAGEAARWTGEDLQGLGLNAVLEGGRVRIPASETPVQGVVTTGPISLDVEALKVVRLRAPGLHPATGTRLFWRRSDAPQAFESVPLETSHAGTMAMGMDEVPGWSGTVIEVGVLLTGDVPEPVMVDSLAVEPLTPASLWPVLWTQWRSFVPWKQAGINFLDVSRGTYFSPVVAAALWVALATLCYWLRARRLSWDWRWVFGVFLIAWMLLDLRFQSDLLFKLRETRFTYAGKSTEQRLASGPDAPLHEAAVEFLERVDVSASRVFILTQEDAAVRGYKRQRLHYYLLPINALSLMPTPPPADLLIPGDVIFVYGPHSGLRFDGNRGQLSWGEGQSVPAVRLYANPNATAYRVEAGPS